jgi:hypothetical protein
MVLASLTSGPALTLKASEKGAVSLHGTGRWPITMYMGTWYKVLGMADEIRGLYRGEQEQVVVQMSGEARKHG